MAVGESAGAPVFWCCKGNEATLLIGNDDQTWDVAVNFPVRVVDEIVREAEQEP
jgi:DNA polymerase IIIc chi subunit